MKLPRSSTARASRDIELRSLATRGEYDKCVELQRAVWGNEFEGLVPASFIKVSQKIGGVGAGAFDADGQLLGFVFGMTGVENRQPVHWSHMLAVREDARNRGIGRYLKMYQRKLLRSLGVEVMYWTFDPLIPRNAHFNLNRLGADVREYVPDMYGDTGSKLHSHGTDRFIVAWSLSDSTRVNREDRTDFREKMPEIEGAPIVNSSPGADGRAIPLERDLPDEWLVLIEIPAYPSPDEIAAGPFAQWRAAIRRAFVWYLARNYEVVGFHTREKDARCFYVLMSRGPSE